MFDYKILIILVVVVLFMILIYREIYVFKEEFHNGITNIAHDVKEENESAMRNIQNNMIKYVHQIKGISADNIKELHKVTAFNSEHVTSRPNHFSEIYDSDMRGESDARGKVDIFHKPTDPPMEYYMSEHTRCTHDTDGDADDGSVEVIECKNGVCPLPRKGFVMEPVDDDLPRYSDEKKNSESIPEYVKPPPTMALSSPAPPPTPSVTVVEDPEESDGESNSDDETDSESSEESHPLDESNSAPPTAVPHDNTPEKKSEDTSEESDSSDDDDDDSEEESDEEPEPEPQPKHNPKMKSVSSYTVNQLKRIALRFKLSLNYKQDGKTKTYKKDELYKVIHDYLMDNKLTL